MLSHVWRSTISRVSCKPRRSSPDFAPEYLGFSIPFKRVVSTLPQVPLEAFERAFEEFSTEADPFSRVDSIKTVIDRVVKINEALRNLKKSKYTEFTDQLSEQYQKVIYSLEFDVEEWADDFQDKIKSELKLLEFLLCHSDHQIREQGLFQLLTLQKFFITSRQIFLSLQSSGENWETEFKKASDLFQKALSHLVNLGINLENGIEKISDLLEPFDPLPELSVKYGSAEWKNWVSQRPSIPKPWLASKIEGICSYLNPFYYVPESWRPNSSQVISVFFTALIVGQQVERIIYQSQHLPTRAQRSQLEVLKAVPPEKVAQIEKEASFVGNILSDKYAVLSQQEVLEALTRRYPETLPTLLAVHHQLGSDPPTQQLISQMMDLHRTTRMVHESPVFHPLRHLSFQEWWKAFTLAQETEAHSESQAKYLLPESESFRH